MPLAAADPRPRNPFGQFAGGTSVTPDQMNRAYGIRTRVLASLLRTRPAMQNIPPLSSKDIARVTGLAAKARSVVAFAGEEKPQRKSHTLRNVAIGIGAAGALGAGLYYGTRGRAKIKHTPALPLSGPVAAPKPERYTGGDDFDYGVPKGAKGYRMRPASSAWDPNKGLVHTPERREWYSARLGRLTVFSSRLDRVSELARGNYAIPAMYKAKMIPYQSFHPSEYRNPMHANLVETALKRTGPKGIQLRRDRLAKVLRAQRAAPALAGLALSALAARAVELAELPGDKIPRPQFVEDGGFVKIVRPDGTASEIGRAPGFANRLRRNKGKLIVGGLTTAGGAAFARELLRGRRLGKKA
ncbi:MAG: hypothetical protein KA745_06730 [Gemmatimonadales bacterium]|nr:hypothetical protein [Gemmatimonadales bacterium]